MNHSVRFIVFIDDHSVHPSLLKMTVFSRPNPKTVFVSLPDVSWHAPAVAGHPRFSGCVLDSARCHIEQPDLIKVDIIAITVMVVSRFGSDPP